MTKKLLDLSEKIDGFAVELFEITSVVVGRMDLPFLSWVLQQEITFWS